MALAVSFQIFYLNTVIISILQGFRKVDPDQWEFANEEFIQGQRHLLKNIHRRKPIHSHSGQVNALPLLTDSERRGFEKEIEKLRQEKLSLQSKVDKHKHENQGYEYRLKSLGHTLQNIDQRQRRLLATLDHVFQNTQNKKRRPTFSFEENRSPSPSLPLLNLDAVEKLGSSLTFWEEFIYGVDKIPSSQGLRDASYTTYVESPAVSSICVDRDSSNGRSRLDVDMSAITKTRDVELDKDQDRDGGVACNVAAAGGNDVFWQQFLTEAEVESERRDQGDDRMKDGGGFADEHKPWWNVEKLHQ
ncbi:hypothetical protein MIMGU_mgv1a010763mg [Erythranthe guttata]|uniref:HSF-type DNA-binding domain-containing protein n=1 Tax=Erythranthe guttata TaxID=4155 RepID=A0A022QWC2_ERYGU|nr:hypothetical protein MIMGU_mgv1a010763mg [Erythranthe guttata]